MSLSACPETWLPILEDEDAAEAVAAISAIAEEIGEAPLPARNALAPLAAGEAGVALLFGYLDRVHPGAGYGEIAWQRLERAIDALAASRQEPSLYSGFTGVAWAVEHLRGESPGGEDPNEEINAALLRLVRHKPWNGHYDLTGGLVGYGVYLLERLPRPTAASCLELVVQRLAEIAQLLPEGLVWHTPCDLLPEAHRAWYPQGYNNLGVAHGTPGVIALLAQTCASGIAAEQSRSLMQGAMSWLLDQKLPESEDSVFPYVVSSGVKARPARTAWCYGDAGISVAQLAAARAARVPAWEHEAIAMARTIARRPPDSCGVKDAGLCHGAAGVAHLLNRFYQTTGDSEVLAAARSWFRRSLGYRQPNHGIGGFLAWSPADHDFNQLVWSADPGFLMGSAGVALALIAATSRIDPAWDRVLLASPPMSGPKVR